MTAKGFDVMGWLYLLLAAVFEVSFTTTLRLSHNFANWKAVLGFLVSVALSLVSWNSLSRPSHWEPPYAVWTGIGAVGTVVIGMAWFGEPATLVRGLLIAGIVGCAIGLKLTANA